MLCDDGDWNHVFTRQVLPTMDSNHQKLGERRETDSPSEPLEGTNLADTLTSDFWPPELWDDVFLLF